jgi:hydroxymethylglutaryl-CoA reductase
VLEIFFGQIMCAVGLAQNFAAIRALAIEGIQRGHMGLHARNIAIAAGVPHVLVPEVAAYMVARNKVGFKASHL